MTVVLAASSDGPFGPPYHIAQIIILLVLLAIIAYCLFFHGGGEAPTLEDDSDHEAESDEASDSDSAEEAKEEPAAEPEPEPTPEGMRRDEKLGLVYSEAPDNANDLTKISGVGPVLAQKLNDFGVYRFEQVANWNDDVIEEFSSRLSFKDRVKREDWVGQAKKLC